MNHIQQGCLHSRLAVASFFVVLLAAVLLRGGTVLARGTIRTGSAGQVPCIDPTYGLPLPASFRQSYPKPPDWIWAATVGAHQTVYLIKQFRLAAMPNKPILYVTADNFFAAYVNGHKVAQRDHGTMSWGQVIHVPVKRYLHSGTNTIALRATNDGGPAGAILELMNGNQTLVKTDGTWKLLTHVPKSARWRTAPKGLHLASVTVECRYGGGPWFDGLSPWPVAYLHNLYFQPQRIEVLHHASSFRGLGDVARKLTAANRALLRPGYRGTSTLTPWRKINLVVSPVHNGPAPELLLSFGQEVAGCIQVRGTGGMVSIGTGESRGEALNQPWHGYHQLRLKTGHTLSTPNSAFRYATISFHGHAPIHITRLRLDFMYYPVAYRGAFSCSDPLLTKIWYTGAYTCHLCMQEDIWDAPKRDRRMWMGDLQISGEVINNVFLDHFLMEQTMRRLRQQAQGNNPPASLPENDVNGIPGYSCAWICGLANFYKHTGAIGYIRSQKLLLLSMLQYMRQSFNSHHLFDNRHHHWCFTDWANKLNGNTPQSYTATDLYTCMAVRRAVFLLRAMGDRTDAHRWNRWDQAIINAARRHLANPATETYTSLRQVNAMAIDSGVATAEQRAAIYKRILGPQCASWRQQATPYYNNFVMFALAHLGKTNQGLAFIQKYWGGMIREGATTFWEAYDPSWPKRHFHRYLKADNSMGYFVSLCHGWSCGVTNWLTQYVLGVNATSGGFATATIAPHLGNLQWARGTVPTPHGNIVLKVRKNGSKESMQLVLPAGIHTTVSLPGHALLVNGKPAHLMKGSRPGRCHVRIDAPGVWTIRAD